MSDFNLTTYCENPTSNTALADCAVLAQINAVSAQIADVSVGINVFFLLITGAMVFFMQTGFCMLCAGSVRQKNVRNIVLKNLLDACCGAVAFWGFGYAFAFGGQDSATKTFIGNQNFFLRDFSEGLDYINWFFQWAFAASAATIVAGTIAERCQMIAYLCYSGFLTGFVYAVIVHWMWSSSGFLSAFNSNPFRGVGAIDFAGSGVVHLTGGITALVAAIILGPRKGRFYDEDGRPLETPAVWPPHNVALQVLGTFCLWFGWYGFNPGSVLFITSADLGSVSALAAVTTTLAPASGAISAMLLDTLLDYLANGHATWDVGSSMNGALTGLVAITAGCSTVTPWAAVVIGTVAGWVYLGGSKLMIKLRIDDAVDAVPVHFGGGVFGVLVVGLLAEPDRMTRAGYNAAHPGLFYSWSRGNSDANLLLCQFCEVLFIIGWVCVVMIPFFSILNYLRLFRVDPLEELVGLDISHHRGAAYDLGGPNAEDVEKLNDSRHGSKLGTPNTTQHQEFAVEDDEA